MAQSEQVVNNTNFPAVRAAINDNLAALFSQSSGASGPSVTVAGQTWVDTSTSPPTWRIMNADNSAWITVGVLGDPEDSLTFRVGGVAPIANGGTGQTTAAAAIAGLLPDQSGNASKALITNGSALAWAAVIGSSFEKIDATTTYQLASDKTTLIVIAFGAGGAGGRNSSGGGGGGAGGSGVLGVLKASEVRATSSNVAVTVGVGGAGRSSNGNGADGGDSSFGSYVVGYHGKGGDDNSTDYAEGARAWGSSSRTTDAVFIAQRARNAPDIFSGGTGGKGASIQDGGNAVFGGGAGGGRLEPIFGTSGGQGSGGVSVFGGNGGAGAENNAVSGAAPGGGGGGSQDGTSGSGGNGAVWVLAL